MASIETDDSQAKTFQIQSNDGEIYTIDQGVVDQSMALAGCKLTENLNLLL